LPTCVECTPSISFDISIGRSLAVLIGFQLPTLAIAHYFAGCYATVSILFLCRCCSHDTLTCNKHQTSVFMHKHIFTS
jgi:hypothetical protein